jgi:hypothetical protein
MRGPVIGNVPTHPFAEDRHSRYGLPFLASHRALAACTRELARLADEVVRSIAAFSAAVPAGKATVRRSPDRCIVQLGPVALTIAWLRGAHDAVDAGELLVIVWQGSVAPRTHPQPERPVAARATVGATPLWERVLTATAESEETWAWQPQGDEQAIKRYSSAELATRCVDRLRAAYLEREVPLPLDRDVVSVG